MLRKMMCSGACLALFAGATQAAAAETDTGVAEPRRLDQVVVIGSRAEPRLATETSAPVDLLPGDDLARRGQSDLAKTLQAFSPSFNYPRASTGPSSAGARPATLRGLSPDQTLVLVNGRRRHASSIINFNNTVGRGSVPVDLNMIPTAAVERVEILRDGAGAQYGSDAIAGVISIELKGATAEGMAVVQHGRTSRGDGETTVASMTNGFSLLQGGWLMLSGEVRDRRPTNAAEIDQRFGRVTQRLGDPATTDLQFAMNAAQPLNENVELSGFLTVARRDSEMVPLYRTPAVAPAFYPNGFLPVVNLDLTDIGGSVGIIGTAAGWAWELSNTSGFSEGEYNASNTVNTSLGADSPTAFYGGSVRYRQNIVNAAVNRSLDLLGGANFAAGIEHRYEDYRIEAGDTTSYALSGAQGFPGFNPPAPVDENRTAFSVYADGELTPLEGLTLGAAIRYENYSDFGEKTAGKISAFWKPVDLLALRATASTGIRAPSLQQQYFSTVTSQLLPTGQIANVGNFSVTDPVSLALGSSALRAETSENLSAGIIITPLDGLSLSVDIYRIDIADRISLSENIQGPAVAAILQANGITNAAVARFFTNAADTRSEGWEATLRWEASLTDDSRLGFSAGWGVFDTDLTKLQTNPVLPQIALLGPASIGLLTDAQPRNKLVLNADYSWAGWQFTLDGTRYGSLRVPTSLGVQEVKGSSVLDVTLAYGFRGGLTLQAGLVNALDEMPARVSGDNTGRPYTEADPLGFNGQEWFVRLKKEF